MRLLVVAILLAGLILPASMPASAASNCRFVLGFEVIYDAMPDIVGECRVNEHYAADGGALQETTRGLLVWRKSDNFTAFTDGYRTWVNGPNGIQQRLNTERFDWENDPLAPRIVRQYPQRNGNQIEEVTQWSDGRYTVRVIPHPAQSAVPSGWERATTECRTQGGLIAASWYAASRMPPPTYGAFESLAYNIAEGCMASFLKDGDAGIRCTSYAWVEAIAALPFPVDLKLMYDKCIWSGR